ncbi:hypothetical protein J132_02703 [Termitomyces sp. J132]|nr:hypothetical protein J132_02703 [Termitomyces sp. J132]
MRCLNVYTPNNPIENSLFWAKIKDKWRQNQNKPKVEVILGDMNLVEEAADHMPAHDDYQPATETLSELKNLFHLTDGWCRENPTTLDTFYMAGQSIQSQIDQIYIKESSLPYSWDWAIEQTGINTDHLMVTATILKPWQLYMGSGRYAMPAYLAKDPDLLQTLERMGMQHQERMEQSQSIRTQEINPQSLHKSFKTEVIKEIRRFSKQNIPKIEKELRSLRADKGKILNDPEISIETREMNLALLDDRIKMLEIRCFAKARDTVATNFFVNGESLARPWINLNKEWKPRDMIAALKARATPRNRLERNSKKMAELA